MADNLPNILLETPGWVDLYDLTAIAVGAQLEVQNLGTTDVEITTQATIPDDNNDAYNIIPPRDLPYRNEAGESGAWARSPQANGKLSVREVV